MIFDTIKYGTFAGDDFVYAHSNKDFSKFTSLPIDVRKKFIFDAMDCYKTRYDEEFRATVFDFMDGKINSDQLERVFWRYWDNFAAFHLVAMIGGMVGASWAVGLQTGTGYYHSYFGQHASHLNKLILEYQS